MDHVEKEFQSRDESILSLERKVDEYKAQVTQLQNELTAKGEVIMQMEKELEQRSASQRVSTY